jgi:hypothetical protein
VGGGHVAGWLTVREMEMAMWPVGPVASWLGWLAGASNNRNWKPRLPIYILSL